jgi:protein TonB
MFWGMHFLIQGHHAGMQKADTLPTIDFVRLKRQSELQTIERRKPPPPPPPPKTPPPPKLKVSADTPQESPLPVNMPSLGLSANVGGGPFLGPMGSGGGAVGPALFEGNITPLQRIAPQCPRRAAEDGLSGEVVLEILVNADGSVESATVLSSKPRGIFDAAAVSAAKRWKFKPQVVDGKPVPQKGRQPLTFNCGEE